MIWDAFTHKQASADEPPHEPDIKGNLLCLQLLPIGKEEQQVGDDGDEGRGQQDEPRQASTFPSAAHFFFTLPSVLASLVVPCAPQPPVHYDSHRRYLLWYS